MCNTDTSSTTIRAINRIISDKEKHHYYPLIATFKEIYDRHPDSWATMYENLLKLQDLGLIEIGRTLNDNYVTITSKHYESR